MNKKRIVRLILVTFCILVTAYISVRLAWRQTEEPQPEEEQIGDVVIGERITRHEANRLLSYIISEKALSECGLSGVTLSDDGNEGDNLTCGELREMLITICNVHSINYQTLLGYLPERLRYLRTIDEVLVEEFLSLYETCWQMIDDKPETSKLIQNKEIFILWAEKHDDGFYIIDETGNKYSCPYFIDYSDLFTKNEIIFPVELQVVKSAFRGYETDIDCLLEGYADMRFEAVMSGDEIIYIKAVSDKTTLIENVWLIEAEQGEVKAFIQGIERSIKTAALLETRLEQYIADIEISSGQITSITIKPDVINGKVLLTSSGSIEIDGYGLLELDQNFRIYKIYDELEMELTTSILVGYSNTDFVISEGKICAALIKEKIKAENVRVVISVDRTSNYYHESVTFTADKTFDVTQGALTIQYDAGTKVTMTFAELLAEGERVKITTSSENGKIQLLSITRQYGNPVYRGSIELFAGDEGIVVINELSIEEYLYTVVPSEMPTSYGIEALKVQAVCARSYVYMQLYSGRYTKFGAHVDDTVNCQVYNNIRENDDSIFAVKDTYGRVMEYDGNIISAFFFSTSCGYTANIEDVWNSTKALSYYSGKLQTTTDNTPSGTVDLSEEELFRSFIDEKKITYTKSGKSVTETVELIDSEFGWFRWHCSISADVLGERINKALAERYASNPAYVLTFVEGEESYITASGRVLSGRFVSKDISSIGTLQNIEIQQRASSGIILEMIIYGSENTILVKYQTNVRTLLAPLTETIYLCNNTTVSGFSLLPSAFCYIDKFSNGDSDTYTIVGGGYGHGVGMSQNGVKALISSGYNFMEILKHYYNGIDIGFIY